MKKLIFVAVSLGMSCFADADSYDICLSSKMPDFFGQKDFAIRVHERAFSRYPEIANQGPMKMKTVSDQHDEYFSKRVDWFYTGISSIRGAAHNNQFNGDAADSTR